MCYHSQQRSTSWESIVLSGCHMPSLQLLNGFSNYTHLQEKKTLNVSQWERIGLSYLSKCIWQHKKTRKKTVETRCICCRYIKHHLQYANVNLSFCMHTCRNSITGQSSITLQSSSVWIMVTVTAHRSNSKPQPSITGQCLPLKQRRRQGSARSYHLGSIL